MVNVAWGLFVFMLITSWVLFIWLRWVRFENRWLRERNADLRKQVKVAQDILWPPSSTHIAPFATPAGGSLTPQDSNGRVG